MSKRSHAIVIDASIAHAAGPEDAVHPTSRRCRDFLLAVRENADLAMAFPASIRDEWNRHRSGFSLTWQRSMVAAKRVRFDEVASRPELRIAVVATAVDAPSGRAMEKDFHLIEVALGTPAPIASLDENARVPFRVAAISVVELRHVVWVNPCVPDEDAVDWVSLGAPTEPRRTLGAGV